MNESALWEAIAEHIRKLYRGLDVTISRDEHTYIKIWHEPKLTNVYQQMHYLPLSIQTQPSEFWQRFPHHNVDFNDPDCLDKIIKVVDDWKGTAERGVGWYRWHEKYNQQCP
jgi:hypothetical protein